MLGRAERCQQLAEFWAPIAGESGECLGSSVLEGTQRTGIQAVPVPASEIVVFRNARGAAAIYDGAGRLVLHVPDAAMPVDVSALSPGAYVALFASRKGLHRARFVVSR